jgi:hypothetical protein
MSIDPLNPKLPQTEEELVRQCIRTGQPIEIGVYMSDTPRGLSYPEYCRVICDNLSRLHVAMGGGGLKFANDQDIDVEGRQRIVYVRYRGGKITVGLRSETVMPSGDEETLSTEDTLHTRIRLTPILGK